MKKKSNFFVIGLLVLGLCLLSLSPLKTVFSADEDESLTQEKDKSENVDLTFILDYSGSMNSKIVDETKVDLMKNALEDVLEDVTGTVPVSIWAFGQTYSSQEKEKSCKDAREIYQSSVVDKAKVTEALDGARPNGFSPVAYSLEQVLKNLETDKEHVVILISDGEEACGEDPVKVVEEGIKGTDKTRLSTIGFAVDSKAKAQLEAVALAGEGEYYPASDGETLLSALQEEIKLLPTAKVEKGEAVEMAGGSNFEEAKAFNKELFSKTITLKDHIKADGEEFWKINLTPGQGLKITVNTANKDIQFSDSGEAKETDDAPSAGINVYDSNKAKLFDVSVQQTKNGTKSGEVWEVPAEKDAYVFYLGVGYWLPIHKGMTFTVDLVEQYDSAVGKGDASGDLRGDLTELTSKDYTGYLSGSDKVDNYVLPLFEGQKLMLTLLPSEKEASFLIELYDSSREILETIEAKAAGEKVELQKDITTDDKYLLSISGGTGKYSLTSIVEGEKKEEVKEIAPMTNEQDLIGEKETKPESFLSKYFGDNLLLFLAIPVGVFIVIILIIVVVIMKKRRKGGVSSDKPGISSRGTITTAPPTAKTGNAKVSEEKPAVSKEQSTNKPSILDEESTRLKNEMDKTGPTLKPETPKQKPEIITPQNIEEKRGLETRRPMPRRGDVGPKPPEIK